jgi:L-fucose mutarotase/ribose pyranase (RbsD/FucU family)
MPNTARPPTRSNRLAFPPGRDLYERGRRDRNIATLSSDAMRSAYRAKGYLASPAAEAPVRIERQQFYERARNAFAILMTGENRKYGNIILKKGVIIV